jgi:ABC-2 type transport system ATP-binding protein
MGGYSTGMKQRAKLAQALVHDPHLVLLDEPTNGLDPRSADDMLALVRKIGTEFGIAVLVTSHLLGELERVSDHVVVLDAGRLLRSSATTDYLHSTGTLVVEVLGGRRESELLAHALAGSGVPAQVTGRLVEVEARDESTRDAVRDLTVELRLGIVRMQERHHRIEDVFRDEEAGRAQPSEGRPPGPSTTSATGPTPASARARAPWLVPVPHGRPALLRPRGGRVASKVLR